MKNRVLISINNFAYFNRMMDLARCLRSDGNLEPILYLHAFSTTHAQCQNTALADGIPVSNLADPLTRESLGAKVLRKIRGLSSTRLSLAWEIFDILVLRARIYSIIREHSASAVIMPEDCPDYGAPAIISTAKAARIPVILFGCTGIIPREVQARIYMYNDRLTRSGRLENWIRRKWPKWAFEFMGQNILRSPPETILAQEILGISSSDPWSYHSSEVDTVISDCEAVRDYYSVRNIPSQRFQILGFHEHDLMAKIMDNPEPPRSAVERELGFTVGRPLLLLALVQEHFIFGAPDCEFRDHPEMVDFIASAVRSLDSFNVVVSCHPSMDPHQFKYIESDDMRISERKISELIPLCDLFVACSSTTIPWAAAAGKPVINYDTYQYGDGIAYEAAKGVVTVQKKVDFLACIERLRRDPAYLAELTAQQKQSASKWGKLDGKAHERILRAIQGAALIGEKEPR